MEIWHDKIIPTNQYKVDLCDSIHINEIISMMTILESTKYSNNIHLSLGEEDNKGGCLIENQGLHIDPKWYNSNHVNGCTNVEHGINHLIIGH